MKILCVSCGRLAELGGYRLDAGVLFLTCRACGAEMPAVDAPPRAAEVHEKPSLKVVPLRPAEQAPAATAARVAQSGDPYGAPNDRCPKCVARKSDGDLSCSQCGLTFVNFVPAEVVPPQPVDGLWREVLTRWDDVRAHDAVLTAAVATQALPQLARLYQLRLALDENDLMARRGRDEVVRLATASATAAELTRTVPPDRSGAKLALAVIGFVVLLVLTGMLIRQIAVASGH